MGARNPPPETQYIRELRDSSKPRPASALSFDLARSIAGRVEIHLLSGNHEAAQLALTAGLADHAQELLLRAARSRRTRTEWLQAPLADLELPLREHNALEEGEHCETVADAIAAVNSNPVIENFGEVAIERFWRAVSAAGLGDMRKLSAAETVQRRSQISRAKANVAQNSARARRRREQVAAGGLGGRKMFARGVAEVFRGRDGG